MSHRNSPLTPTGRLLLCRRIAAGAPVAHVAAAMGISRQCAHKWWVRYCEAGPDGLHDRSSRPHASPGRTPLGLERRILVRRAADKAGPHRIAARLEVAPSTVYRVLVRHDVNRLDRLDRATGAPIRRYERSRPGELVHIDVKKLGRIPTGGGHRHHGRAEDPRHSPPATIQRPRSARLLANTRPSPIHRQDICGLLVGADPYREPVVEETLGRSRVHPL